MVFSFHDGEEMNQIKIALAEVESSEVIRVLEKVEELVTKQSWLTPEIQRILSGQVLTLIDYVHLLLTIRIGIDLTRLKLKDEMWSDFAKIERAFDGPPEHWDADEAVLSVIELQQTATKLMKQIDRAEWANNEMRSVMRIGAENLAATIAGIYRLREADQDGVKN